MARLWLEVASRLDLNIFKGFKDEKSLLDFALNASNSKAGDSSTVVAGEFAQQNVRYLWVLAMASS